MSLHFRACCVMSFRPHRCPDSGHCYAYPYCTNVGQRCMEAKEFTPSGTRVQVPGPCLSSDLCVQLLSAGVWRKVGGCHRCRVGVDLSLASPQGQYRAVLYGEWVKQLVAQNVPHTSEPTLIGTLGNPVKIRSWQVPTGAGGGGWLERLGWAYGRVQAGPGTSCLSHPLSFICSEMLPLNPPRPSRRVVVRSGES